MSRSRVHVLAALVVVALLVPAGAMAGSPSPLPSVIPGPPLAVGCDPGPAIGDDAGPLVVTRPLDCELVGVSPVLVTGTAPAGADIVRDIPMWPDEHATAGVDGGWAMTVDIGEGENTLTFRVGDDHATEVVVRVWLDPALGAAATPATTAAPVTALALGDTLREGPLAVTVDRVDGRYASDPWGPEGGKQWVAVHVRYRALADADYSDIEDWMAADHAGWSGEGVLLGAKDPALGDGRLRKGRSIDGWLTFEFAAGVRAVTLTYTDGLFGAPHDWFLPLD